MGARGRSRELVARALLGNADRYTQHRARMGTTATSTSLTGTMWLARSVKLCKGSSCTALPMLWSPTNTRVANSHFSEGDLLERSAVAIAHDQLVNCSLVKV